ncbi:MAG: PstS family phosphate ABC transporter substrate-binding protein [Pseudanabaenaceae cyanobacterium bins.39]|nr:PstS family phosphate ABC transporter substrate-binding protein [Pseudanabaenaceae cyanobacterium bins.39]
MHRVTFSQVATIAAVSTIAISSSFVSVANAQSVIKVDGSSTVFPIMERAASDFQKSGGARVTVGVSGTGGGFKKFCNGDTDISNASRPILKKEIDACRAKGINYFELPISYDGIAVVVNPQNTWAKDLTVDELKRIWAPGSQIKNWSQVRQGFPNVPLKLFGPGPDSGTFDYFTEAIVGKSKSSRTDYTPSEDDNVLVRGVSSDRGALGYFGKSYLETNTGRIRAVGIIAKAGARPVMPSDATIQNATYQPLSRPMFIYVNANAAKRPEVKRFVTYLFNNGNKIVKQARYTPFPQDAYSKILANFNKNKLGTIFGGNADIGLTIGELISREAR